MKTDREFLELAARAADNGANSWSDCHQCLFISTGPYPNKYIKWSPLTDDGDALRLAAKLNISIVFDMQPDGPYVYAQVFDLDPDLFGEPLSRDTVAATRRAIVRAAAAIGETL